jgi:peptidoglycan/LPS O-acetylase OafA/YrhL
MRSTVVQPGPLGTPPLFTALFALLGLTALALAFPRTEKRRLQLATGFAGIVLLVAGCGGDGKPAPGPKGLGTPAGTSAVIVTASSASGGATASSTVNLTVQ